MAKKPKNIVVIGGGTGTFTILLGLRKYNYCLTAIVSMVDDGGSTGKLRDELGVLPPGDVRQCLVALAECPELMRHLFNYRFITGSLRGHNFGNLFISALEKLTGRFDKAIEEAGRVLAIHGRVVPVTLNKVRLRTILESGQELIGEHQINNSKLLCQTGIRKIFLKPRARANLEAVKVIQKADLIVIGPGNLYCSIIPNFLVQGIPQAIKKSKAKKVFICNLMTKYGHTDNFSVSDFVKKIENYLGQNILNSVIYNTQHPPKTLLKKYVSEGKMVSFDKRLFQQESRNKNIEIIGGNLLSGELHRQESADQVQRSFVRHDSDKLAKVILSIIKRP
jgi:uncharacterized cofD-like protein